MKSGGRSKWSSSSINPPQKGLPSSVTADTRIGCSPERRVSRAYPLFFEMHDPPLASFRNTRSPPPILSKHTVSPSHPFEILGLSLPSFRNTWSLPPILSKYLVSAFHLFEEIGVNGLGFRDQGIERLPLPGRIYSPRKGLHLVWALIPR